MLQYVYDFRDATLVVCHGLDAKIHAALDNFVSRCIGFVIRVFVIVAAAVGMIMAFMASTVMAVLWPLLPVLLVICTVKGITG